MNYDRVFIFTKKGNLLDYLGTEKVRKANSGYASSSVKAYYEEEREIQLILSVRWDCNEPRCFCKIKCPVNPLPVKGEFEAPSFDSLRTFLKANGWTLKQTIASWMFK